MPPENVVGEERDKKIVKRTFSHVLDPKEGEKCKGSTRVLRLVIPGLDTVREVTSVLSKEECEGIIEETSTCEDGFSRPTAFSTDHRDCVRIHTIDKEMSNIMMRRLRPYLPEIVIIDNIRWQLSRFTHHWRYVRYYPGGHFTPHYDGVKMSSEPVPCMSVFTVQVYLNGAESYSGGATRFYPDYKPDRKPSREIKYGHVSEFDPSANEADRRYDVLPETGKALIFNHALNTLHDGEVVLSGTKYIMRGDVLYTALPEDAHMLPTFDSYSEEADLKQRHWCPFTAAKHGTRNHVGEVWYCACANDQHGASIENEKYCWHNNTDLEKERVPQKPTQKTMPKILVLVSGKRAVGKDHISDLLRDCLLGKDLSVYRAALGNFNKRLYAEYARIDYARLLTDREFKESHRIAMVRHHTEKNAIDPYWCVREVLRKAKDSDVMIISDLRTYVDLKWFQKQNIPVVLLRIDANDDARERRGWDPCPVKDALNTEIDLDDFLDWTASFDNSVDSDEGNNILEHWIEYTVLPRILMLI